MDLFGSTRKYNGILLCREMNVCRVKVLRKNDVLSVATPLVDEVHYQLFVLVRLEDHNAVECVVHRGKVHLLCLDQHGTYYEQVQ